MEASNVRPHAREAGLVIRELPDEVLVYDLDRHKAHCLNQTAAIIWKNCNGQHTVPDIARMIGEELGSNMDEALVWLAIDRMGKADLLLEPVTPPTNGPRLSRRQIIKKLGLGAAMAVPLVMSIVAPTAVSATSCVANGQQTNCNSSTANNCCSKCCEVKYGSTLDTCKRTGRPNGDSCKVNCQCACGSCQNGKCGGSGSSNNDDDD